MKTYKSLVPSFALLVTAFLTSGCYTQFASVEKYPIPKDQYSDYYSWDGNNADNPTDSGQRDESYTEQDSLDQSTSDVYYKDYEAENWYKENYANGLYWYREGYVDGYHDGFSNIYSRRIKHTGIWLGLNYGYPYHWFYGHPHHWFDYGYYSYGTHNYYGWGYPYYARFYWDGFYHNSYFINNYYYYLGNRYARSGYGNRSADIYYNGPRNSGLSSAAGRTSRTRGISSKTGNSIFRTRSGGSAVGRSNTGASVRSATGRSRGGSGSSVDRRTGRKGSSVGTATGRVRTGTQSTGRVRGTGSRTRKDGNQNIDKSSVRSISVNDVRNRIYTIPSQKVQLRNADRTKSRSIMYRLLFNEVRTNAYRIDSPGSSSARYKARQRSINKGSGRSNKVTRSRTKASSRSTNSRNSSSNSSSKRKRGGN